MQADRLWKHLLIGFGIALVAYIGFFVMDQHVRSRKGGWEVSFSTNLNGAPGVIVSQKALGIHNVSIGFPGETATNGGVVVFNRPRKPLPFGTVKFEDLTYLPGSVAFDFFGHEVELLPRTLYLNKQEKGWGGATNYILTPEEKLPPEAHYDPRKKKRRR